jgi:hypothetical protein
LQSERRVVQDVGRRKVHPRLRLRLRLRLSVSRAQRHPLG